MGWIGIGHQIDRFEFFNQTPLVEVKKAFGIIHGKSNFYHIPGVFHIDFIKDVLMDDSAIESNSSFEGTEKELFQLFLVEPLDRGLA